MCSFINSNSLYKNDFCEFILHTYDLEIKKQKTNNKPDIERMCYEFDLFVFTEIKFYNSS